MTSYYYENPHISLSGTLSFLQSASNVEVEAASGISRAVDSTAFIDIHDEGVPIDRGLKEPTDDEIHRAYEAFLTDFESSPSIEDSFAICWQPLSVIQRAVRADATEAKTLLEYQKSYLRRLPNILEQTKARIAIEPDGYILDRDAAILIHLSVGLILLAEQVEGGQSERQWEWLDDALQIFRMPETESVVPFYEETKFPRTISLSYEIAKALMLTKSANRFFNQHKYEDALRHYSTALLGIWIANNDIFRWWSDEDELSDEKRHTEFVIENAFEDGLLENEEGEPLSGGLDLWRMFRSVVEFENAIKAFDALVDEDSRDTDWTQLANYCWFFSKNWHLLSLPVESKHIPEQETVSESWTIAHGIVLNMMSNDDRIKELRRNRDYQIEDRLRLYFFGETWHDLPDKARAALISADREYENTLGRRPIIFDHLRHAARAIMVESLWKPYREFLRDKAASGLKDLSNLQQVRQIIEDDQSEPDLAPLVNSPHFDEFLGTISGDTKFVRRLPDKLLDLNEWANKVSHEHHWGYKGFEGQIRDTYAEFLGIGRNGILPRLMRLHPKAARR